MHTTEEVGLAAALFARIRGVLGSNFGGDIGHVTEVYRDFFSNLRQTPE
jgi:hypothetical protein